MLYAWTVSIIPRHFRKAFVLSPILPIRHMESGRSSTVYPSSSVDARAPSRRSHSPVENGRPSTVYPPSSVDGRPPSRRSNSPGENGRPSTVYPSSSVDARAPPRRSHSPMEDDRPSIAYPSSSNDARASSRDHRPHSPVEDGRPSAVYPSSSNDARASSSRRSHSPVENGRPSTVYPSSSIDARASSRDHRPHSPGENDCRSTVYPSSSNDARASSRDRRSHSPVENGRPSTVYPSSSVDARASSRRSHSPVENGRPSTVYPSSSMDARVSSRRSRSPMQPPPSMDVRASSRRPHSPMEPPPPMDTRTSSRRSRSPVPPPTMDGRTSSRRSRSPVPPPTMDARASYTRRSRSPIPPPAIDTRVASSRRSRSPLQPPPTAAGSSEQWQISPSRKRRRSNSPDGTVKTIRVAVVGCTHGEVDKMYEAIDEVERATSRTVDLAICAGDFQAVRNENDLHCLACPPKYRDMRSFWLYYNGQRKARTPTIFVGGNHEASNHLQEIPLGGLVAPNIYFLGNAGVVSFRGLRIGGMSGVFVDHGYDRPRDELPPYSARGGNSLKSVYHCRKEDVDRLKRIRKPVDVFVSHDWPRGITKFGDEDQLLRIKPFLAGEIADGSFGNPASMDLLRSIKPTYWFAAHMHVKFAAIVPHEEDERSDRIQPTKFLALDKIVPRRDFLQILDIPVPSSHEEDREWEGEEKILLDEEWLTILRTEHTGRRSVHGVNEEEMRETVNILKSERLERVLMKSDFQQRAGTLNRGNRYGNMPRSLRFESRNLALMKALGMPEPFASETDLPEQHAETGYIG